MRNKTATNNVLAKTVAEVARRHLKDELPSATAYVAPMTGQYGDECYRLWVMYDGRVERPTPNLMKSLYRRMRPDLLEHGIENSIIHTFDDETAADSMMALGQIPSNAEIGQ